MTNFDWIADQGRLDELVEQLCVASEYALDTEFHGERTYRPQLALLQVATRERIALVDTLAVDVRALGRALQGEAVCVMHAGAQDLDILQWRCGAVPQRLFDTQLAASFCGYPSASLGSLVDGVLGIRLDKSAQLTDWTRRPLPEDDLRYAAADVAYLLELRDTLVGRLEQQSRLEWAEDEIERLRTKDRSAVDPATLWWKLRGRGNLVGHARGVAQELAAWRDGLASKQNRHPKRVLSDLALLSLAQRPARNLEQLRAVRNLDLRRFGHTEELLDTIRRGIELPEEALCRPPKKAETPPDVEHVIALCIAWLAQRAGQEGLHKGILGTRDDVTSLVIGQPSRLSSGWRAALVGRELRAIVDGTAALRVRGTDLELLDYPPPSGPT